MVDIAIFTIIQEAICSGWVEKLVKADEEKTTKTAKLFSVLKGKKKQWKAYYAVLHSRSLYFYKDEKSLKADKIIELGKYHSVTKDVDHYADKHCLRLLSFGKDDIQYFCVSNEAELKLWLSKIKPLLSSPKEDEQRILDLIKAETETSATSTISESSKPSIRQRLKNFRENRLSNKMNRLSTISNISFSGSTFAGSGSDNDLPENESYVEVDEYDKIEKIEEQKPVESDTKTNVTIGKSKDETISQKPQIKPSFKVAPKHDRLRKTKPPRPVYYLLILLLISIVLLLHKFYGNSWAVHYSQYLK